MGSAHIEGKKTNMERKAPMTQKQYRSIDRYQDLLNRIAPTRLVEQTRQSVIGHEGSLEPL